MLSTTTSTVVPDPVPPVVATLVNVPGVLFTVATSNVTAGAPPAPSNASVSYTHLTLPTKRIV